MIILEFHILKKMFGFKHSFRLSIKYPFPLRRSMSTAQKQYVLYVNQSKSHKDKYCRGSEMCLESVGSSDMVHIQDIMSLKQRGAAIPEWLNGTPIIVDRDTSQAYRGTSAVNLARSISSNKTVKETPSATHDIGRPSSSRTGSKMNSDPQGVLPPGEQHHHDDNSSLDDSFQTISGNIEVKDNGKVTDEVIEAYMKQRGFPKGDGEMQ